MPPARRMSAFAVAVVVAAALSGCVPRPEPTPATIVLQLAHVDGEPTYDPGATWFAAALDRVSGGRMTAARRVACCGVDQSTQEQALIGAVAAGGYALGWVGVRAFSTLGDDDFQALTLPLLQDSYATQQAVASSDIPRAVFAGLDALGVTGVALMPGYLRKPLSVTHPLLAPRDWAGEPVFLYRGGTNRESLLALGARPVEGGESGIRDDGLVAHTIEGTEQPLVYAAQDTARVRFVTANVNLWPRMSALIMNPDVAAQLTGQQRGWIDQAAEETIRSAGRLATRDHDFAAYECAHGARVVDASAADLAQLRAAFRPVVAAASRHPLTAELVRRIEALRRPDPPEVRPQACAGP